MIRQATQTTLWAYLLAALMGASLAAAQQTTPPPAGANELRIEGLVVDPVGAGVADVEIRIELPDAAEDDPPLAETVSGDKGAITITLTRPKVDTLRFRATKEGFAPYVGELDISDPDDTPFIDVSLQGGATVKGVVTADDTGKPICGVKVSCNTAGKNISAVTGPDGSYSLKSVFYGPAMISVTADGYAVQREPVSIEDDRQSVDFQLAPERRVELTVFTNTGVPAEGVAVEAIAEPTPVRASGITDASGKVVLHGLQSDCMGLSVRLNGERYLAMRAYDEFVKLPPAEGPASTQPARVQARLVVTLAARVHGKVIDKQTGEPIFGVRVTAGREPRYDMPIDWTAADGTYELRGVRPGIVTVTFQHDRYATAFGEADLFTGKTAELNISLEPGEAIGGVVVDEEGNPIDHVRVSAESWRDYRTIGLRTVTGEDGKFLFEHAPPGNIEFTFVRPGFGKPLQLTLATGKRDHRVTLEDADVPMSALRGAVASAPDSQPVPERKLMPGRPVPDLALKAIDGKTYKLSDLRGKYVMLDCWASWCRPCMAEVPNVRAVYEAMKGRDDFILIGISLDTDRKALDKAMADNKIVWPQIFGPDSGANEAFEELDGVGIPYICLIGPDGKLIVQDLRGPQMVETVKKKCEAKSQI